MRCLLISILLVPVASLGASEIPPMAAWGDLGDGRFANPILQGDFADADVERAADRWYLITSTNHLSPGMSVLESRDLIHWEPVAHAVPSLDWDPRYGWEAMDGYRWGVWAGDLVRGEDEWLCYWIDIQAGLLMTSAPAPEGPWSKPHLLRATRGWTDPAIWFDEKTGEAWLVCNTGKDPATGSNDLKLFRLSADGRELLGEGKTIFRDDGLEAAKIHRHEGRWYIMAAAWEGRGIHRDRVQICLRSTGSDIAGPYEKKVIFGRSSPGQHSACQGSLIQIPGEDRWYFLHQLVQNGKPNFHGRPLCLQPAVWRDGWPVIGTDEDGDGKGEPVWIYQKPVESTTPPRGKYHDPFDGEEPGPAWNWNHEPNRERFSLRARPGWLRLGASHARPRKKGTSAFWSAPNTLSLRHLGTGAGEVSTYLDCRGLRPGIQAGLCHFSDRVSLLGVHMTEAGATRVVAGDDGGTMDLGPLSGPGVHLRTRWTGDVARSSWSTDGRQWNEVPGEFRFTFGHWRGVRHGIFCFNTATKDPIAAGHADFDHFTHVYQTR